MAAISKGLLIILLALLLIWPMQGAEEPLQKVSAAEIVSKIQSGEPVEYQNVSVDGYLDLSGLDVKQAIKITDSNFNATNFEGTTFEEPLDLRGSTFQENVSFVRTHFLGDCNFGETRFLGLADFRASRSEGFVSFMNAEFFDDVSFRSSQFNEDAIFLASRFHRDVEFDSVQFSKLVSFRYAEFLGGVSFDSAQLAGTAHFGDAQFNGDAIFAATGFGNNVVFRSSQFRGNIIFGLASFEGLADFSGTRFKEVAFFGVARFLDSAYFIDAVFEKDLILEGARIYSIQLDNATFGDGVMINLKDADFDRFNVRWSILKDRLVFNGATYQALVKNYKNLEWFDDADDCYYQYRRITQDQEPWGWIKFIDIIAWLSCGYGVRVSYSIFWCVFTILLFGAVFWVGNGMRRFEFTGLEVPFVAESVKDQRVSMIDAFYFSTAMFTTSQAPVNTYPVGIYKHLAMIEGILGWFFLGLFVVVLSGVLIR
ncbi:MAG TPA: pentapeptide repeat-containing protein [Methanotrichaceae archaeon]|nr:pentapeptide repeat-containing protein [Methanotrichaceae archaeon]